MRHQQNVLDNLSANSQLGLAQLDYGYVSTQKMSPEKIVIKWKLFPKQFTVGVLYATLELAALVLVGVATFLGSEVVLAPFGSLHVQCERKIIQTFQQVFDQI